MSLSWLTFMFETTIQLDPDVTEALMSCHACGETPSHDDACQRADNLSLIVTNSCCGASRPALLGAARV